MNRETPENNFNPNEFEFDLGNSNQGFTPVSQPDSDSADSEKIYEAVPENDDYADGENEIETDNQLVGNEYSAAPPVNPSTALMRPESNALDIETLRERVRENAKKLPREIAEKYEAVVLDSPYKSYKFRIGVKRELSVDEKRTLSRNYLECYSVSAVIFVVLEPAVFDSLMKEAYQERTMTNTEHRQSQQTTRANRVWGGAEGGEASSGTSESGLNGNAVKLDSNTKFDVAAGKRLDCSDMKWYHEIHGQLQSSQISEGDLSTTDFVKYLFQDFTLSGASDLHLHANRTGGRIRYRYQGIVYTRFSKIPLRRFRKIVNNICTLSGKDPQRMTDQCLEAVVKLRIMIDGEVKDVEYRAASLGTLYCPSLNLRGQPKPMRDINKLGLDALHISQIHDALANNRGIVIITGATGSGKTNTLNCAFSILEEDDDLVILEFGVPIEIESERRVQVSIVEAGTEKQTDVIFQKNFKGAMRFDPDVIAFTEMRNSDEMKICFRAAMSGHLCFTTLHAADVQETLARLFEFGIDRSLIAKGVLAVVSQTLVQTLCKHCRKLDTEASQMAGYDVYRADPVGCPNCDDGFSDKSKTGGYSGRTLVAEVLTFDDRVREMISDNRKPAEIVTDAVNRHHFEPMKNHALSKIKSGLTSEDEVMQLVSLKTEINSDMERVEVEMPADTYTPHLDENAIDAEYEIEP